MMTAEPVLPILTRDLSSRPTTGVATILPAQALAPEVAAIRSGGHPNAGWHETLRRLAPPLSGLGAPSASSKHPLRATDEISFRQVCDDIFAKPQEIPLKTVHYLDGESRIDLMESFGAFVQRFFDGRLPLPGDRKAAELQQYAVKIDAMSNEDLEKETAPLLARLPAVMLRAAKRRASAPAIVDLLDAMAFDTDHQVLFQYLQLFYGDALTAYQKLTTHPEQRGEWEAMAREAILFSEILYRWALPDELSVALSRAAQSRPKERPELDWRSLAYLFPINDFLGYRISNFAATATEIRRSPEFNELVRFDAYGHSRELSTFFRELAARSVAEVQEIYRDILNRFVRLMPLARDLWSRLRDDDQKRKWDRGINDAAEFVKGMSLLVSDQGAPMTLEEFLAAMEDLAFAGYYRRTGRIAEVGHEGTRDIEVLHPQVLAHIILWMLAPFIGQMQIGDYTIENGFDYKPLHLQISLSEAVSGYVLRAVSPDPSVSLPTERLRTLFSHGKVIEGLGFPMVVRMAVEMGGQAHVLDSDDSRPIGFEVSLPHTFRRAA